MPPLPSPWFVFPKPSSQALCRLFCFPYAGGSASVFKDWIDYLPAEVELAAVQLPGRESRFTEDPMDDLGVVVDELLREITPYLSRPFLFFGHSLGAKMAYYLSKQLQNRSLPLPRCLIVSGDSAPHIPEAAPIHGLPDTAFIESLKKYNGLPDEFLQSEELVQLLLPLLRADVKLSETVLETKDAEPLQCPITALGGYSDHLLSISELEAWRGSTAKAFSTKLFPGDHFFIDTEKEAVLQLVNQIVRAALSQPEIV